MTRVALTSDNHFDVNQVDSERVIPQQATWLIDHEVDLYLIAGDLFNHFEQSLTYVQRLQAAVPTIKVRFIAGNHDMLHDVSYTELESPLDPLYLHNQFMDIPQTNWRVIGNNGWYDYQFADNLQGRDFAVWKRAFWVDADIQQPLSDPERMDRVLQQVEGQLKAAQTARKEVLFITHFVPRREYIRYTNDDRFWNMANALMGSPRLGELLTKYAVSKVQFGHMHIHPAPRLLDQTTFYDQAVGYHNRRINEWTHSDFMTEWISRLQILDLV